MLNAALSVFLQELGVDALAGQRLRAEAMAIAIAPMMRVAVQPNLDRIIPRQAMPIISIKPPVIMAAQARTITVIAISAIISRDN